MKRLLAMEKQALTDQNITGVGGAYYFPYQQETFPYFVNRLVDVRNAYTQKTIAEDENLYELEVQSTLVIAHLTSGYKFENADNIYDYIVYIMNYFTLNEGMTSDEYTSPPQYLSPLETQLDFADGVGVFTNAGINAQQVGTRFSITVRYRIPRPEDLL